MRTKKQYFSRAMTSIVLSGMAALTTAASFDCNKVRSKVEHLICDTPEISRLDEELATSYTAALEDEKRAVAIKQTQKQWLKERNGCADRDCVRHAYQVRLQTLASDSQGASASVRPLFEIFEPDGPTHRSMKESCRNQNEGACESLKLCLGLVRHLQSHPPMDAFEPITSSGYPGLKPLDWKPIVAENIGSYRDFLNALTEGNGSNPQNWLIAGIIDGSVIAQTVIIENVGTYDGRWLRTRPVECKSGHPFRDPNSRESLPPLPDRCYWKTSGVSLKTGLPVKSNLPPEYLLKVKPADIPQRSAINDSVSIRWEFPQDITIRNPPEIININGACEIRYNPNGVRKIQ